MVFAEGQEVRIKQGQHVGTIDKKLAHLADMYVVILHELAGPKKKLAHESDLEPVALPDQFSA